MGKNKNYCPGPDNDFLCGLILPFLWPIDIGQGHYMHPLTKNTVVEVWKKTEPS